MPDIWFEVNNFLRKNILRTLIAVAIYMFYHLFAKIKLSQLVNIDTPTYQVYLYQSINIVTIVLNFLIIYMILFGIPKINFRENIKKFLINFILIVFFYFIEEKVVIFINTYFIEKDIILLNYINIFDIFNVVFLYLIFSNFIILENRCDGNFAFIEMWKYFSKTVSKKFLLFTICGYNFLSSVLILDFLTNKEDIIFRFINTRMVFHFFIAFGIIMIFILLKVIVEKDEILETTKILRGRNFKFYLEILIYDIILAFLLTVVIYYIFAMLVFSSFGRMTIFSIILFFIGIIFTLVTIMIFAMINTKIYFKYIGLVKRLSMKKFLKISAAILLTSLAVMVIDYLYIKLLEIFLQNFYYMIEFDGLYNISFIVIASIMIIFNFTVALFSNFQIIGIMNEDNYNFGERIKNSFELTKRFINKKFIIPVLIFASVYLVFDENINNINFYSIIFIFFINYLGLGITLYYINNFKNKNENESEKKEILELEN